jgi:hypothetical protein
MSFVPLACARSDGSARPWTEVEKPVRSVCSSCFCHSIDALAAKLRQVGLPIQTKDPRALLPNPGAKLFLGIFDGRGTGLRDLVIVVDDLREDVLTSAVTPTHVNDLLSHFFQHSFFELKHLDGKTFIVDDSDEECCSCDQHFWTISCGQRYAG